MLFRSHDDTQLNRGNYSLGDYGAAFGMSSLFNSIGKRGITQRDRDKLGKIDDAIDRYSVYPTKKSNLPDKVINVIDESTYTLDNIKSGKIDELPMRKIYNPDNIEDYEKYKRNIKNTKFIDDVANKSPDDVMSNLLLDREPKYDSKNFMVTSNLFNTMSKADIKAYARKNGLSYDAAVEDLMESTADFVNGRNNKLMQDRKELIEQIKKSEGTEKLEKQQDELKRRYMDELYSKNKDNFFERRNKLLDDIYQVKEQIEKADPKILTDRLKEIDNRIYTNTYFTKNDRDKVEKITNKLKDLKNIREKSIFEKNLQMLPTIGRYSITEVADRAGLLANKGEYKVPEDQFEQREIKKSDLRRLYNDILTKYKNKGWSIEDSTKWTPEERYIIENIRK